MKNQGEEKPRIILFTKSGTPDEELIDWLKLCFSILPESYIIIFLPMSLCDDLFDPFFQMAEYPENHNPELTSLICFATGAIPEHTKITGQFTNPELRIVRVIYSNPNQQGNHGKPTAYMELDTELRIVSR